MQIKLSLAAFAAALVCFLSCTPKDACVIEGYVLYPQYEDIYMVDIAGSVIDSTARASDGGFRFIYDKVQEMPQMVVIEFRNPDSPADRMFLPAALEPGKVRVKIDEYIFIGGTPLNGNIKEFLDGLQSVSDGFEAEVSTVDQMKKAYSAYYLKSMQDNSENVFGDYLKLAYGRELVPSDLEILNVQ